MSEITAPVGVPAEVRAARLVALRPFVAAFLAGLIAVLAFSTGALYAYDRNFDGRVLPGVHVGSIDLSGLTEAEAAAALEAEYAWLRDGEIVLATPDGSRRLTYAEIGREPDVEAMVADAMAAGRTADGVEGLIATARTALSGIALAPRVTFDQAALAELVETAAATFDRAPRDAAVRITETAFEVVPGTPGRSADPTATLAELALALADVEAPDELTAGVEVLPIEPTISTAEAEAAKVAADQIAQPVDLALGETTWTIPGETIHRWVSFATTPDGRYEPVLDTTGIAGQLAPVVKDVQKEPKNASFLVDRNGAVVGVTAGANGQALDVPTTSEMITDALRARAAGVDAGPIEPALRETAPALTTEQAEQSAPQMKEISRWTTYFPISEKNGFGANIWIPALDIDGYVVAPGAWFDFWEATGPITRARGYTDGGAIINGRTEPQGALAGGICSCSTTLFNAALRAGLEMGARRNHYYYIDRYPLGLDATVFKSGSGSVQSMTFRNDTESPILIRGIKIRDGNAGYVRFILYSVPNGRTVSLSSPIVKDVVRATDTVEYTSALAPGKRERIEYPVDGKKVWVTRTVRDRDGKVIHQETYYSNYARITGVTLIGTGGATATPTPKPSSGPTPTPGPTAPPAPTPTPPPAPTPTAPPAATATPGG